MGELKGTTVDRLKEALIQIRSFNYKSRKSDMHIYVVTKVKTSEDAVKKALSDFIKDRGKGKIGEFSRIKNIEVEEENYGGGTIPYKVL